MTRPLPTHKGKVAANRRTWVRKGHADIDALAAEYNRTHPWRFTLSEAEVLIGRIAAGVGPVRLTSSGGAE